MPDPKLTAIITALIFVAGAAPSRAEYNLEQLRQIERYILAKDCGALWQYLVENPGIMEGPDALAQELRVFVQATQRGQLQCFAARSAEAPVPPANNVINFAAPGAAIY